MGKDAPQHSVVMVLRKPHFLCGNALCSYGIRLIFRDFHTLILLAQCLRPGCCILIKAFAGWSAFSCRDGTSAVFFARICHVKEWLFHCGFVIPAYPRIENDAC